MTAGVTILSGLLLLGTAVAGTTPCYASLIAFTTNSGARVSPLGSLGASFRERKDIFSSPCDHLKHVRRTVRVSMQTADHSSLGDENGSNLPPYNNNFATRRRERLAMEFRFASFTTFVTALLPLIILLGGWATAQPICFFLYAMSGPLLAATISHILSQNTLHKSLPSNMHKRFSFVLMTYSLLGIVAFILVRPSDRRYFVPLLISCITIMIPAFEEMICGEQGIVESRTRFKIDHVEKIVENLANDVRKTAGTIFPFNKANSTGYLAATFLVTVALLHKLADIIIMFMSYGLQTPDTAFAIASEITTYAKLVLLFTIVFTLTSSADREKMAEMAFIELNLLSSFIFGVLFAYWMEKGNLFLPVGAAICSLFTGINGLVSAIKNRTEVPGL